MFTSADAYLTLAVQGFDTLRATSHRADIQEWALANKIGVATAVITDAGNTNEVLGLIDLAIFATSEREAIEEHWIPTLLGSEGKPLVETLKIAETGAWASAGRVFSSDQLSQLRAVVGEWKGRHPGQYYTSHVRVSDIAAELNITVDTVSTNAPSSLFGLLYLDPLADLDPVAQQLQAYRALTERALFLLARMPAVLGWQADLAAIHITTTPEASSFAQSYARLADAISQLPKDMAAERDAAIRQASAAVAAERQAAIDQIKTELDARESRLFQDLDKQQKQASDLAAKAQEIVASADKTTASANSAAQATIATADQSARGILALAFRYALILIAAVFVATCLTAWVKSALRRGS